MLGDGIEHGRCCQKSHESVAKPGASAHAMDSDIEHDQKKTVTKMWLMDGMIWVDD
jgi:hypothetical protein